MKPRQDSSVFGTLMVSEEVLGKVSHNDIERPAHSKEHHRQELHETHLM